MAKRQRKDTCSVRLFEKRLVPYAGALKLCIGAYDTFTAYNPLAYPNTQMHNLQFSREFIEISGVTGCGWIIKVDGYGKHARTNGRASMDTESRKML